MTDWNILINDINQYINDGSFKLREQQNLVISEKIVNFINSNVTTASGNKVNIPSSLSLSTAMAAKDISVDKMIGEITPKVNLNDMFVTQTKNFIESAAKIEKPEDIKKVEDFIQSVESELDNIMSYPNKILEIPDKMIEYGLSLANPSIIYENANKLINNILDSSIIKNVEEEITKLIDNIPTQDDIINMIPQELKDKYEFIKSLNIDEIAMYPNKIHELVYNLIQAGFSLLDYDIMDLPNKAIDEIKKIIEDIKSDIMDEMAKIAASLVKIPIPLEYGIVMNIIADGEESVNTIKKLVDDMLAMKLALDALLANPYAKVVEIVKQLIPEVDMVQTLTESLNNEISQYTQQIQDIINSGVEESSEVVQILKKEMNALTDKYNEQIAFVNNTITYVENFKIPDVGPVITEFVNQGMNSIIPSAQIIGANSALSGGILINEVVTFPGIASDMSLTPENDNEVVQLVNSIKQKLQTAITINISNYNGQIIPVSSVLNV